MIALLNSPRLTGFGTFQYTEISLAKAAEFLRKGFTSYIGHLQTAEVIKVLTGIVIEINRSAFYQQPGDIIIVFELLERLPDYIVISIEQINKIGYRWGMIERLS